MNKEAMDLFREWIRAEIHYALESRCEGEDGHYHSAKYEEKEADSLFEDLKRKLDTKGEVA